tara:strand:- start:253 stop:402 length:150 start_codon:yes stop_codon:yes gene_type:complete
MTMKIKVLMFLHRYIKLRPEFICEKAGISRATFYRYKKRLNGTIVTKKR